MSDSGENCEIFYICFFFGHFKVMSIIPSCVK
jgi:hypothetical protein